MKQLSYDEMVGAMLADDARYDGRFFVCVRTTGIYCLPSCTARDPKLENVLFFRTREEAVAAGFRSCKRCRSESFPDVTPPWVLTLLKAMRNSDRVRLKECDLVKIAGVDASTIRRHFRTHLDTTPMAFYRRLRLEHARNLMEMGADPLTAALECGFESESGFRDALKRQYGTTSLMGR
jgi:AraC family transcriptional regulator, regulatory protein of adaptative response / methylated-DNA-[protein]-cysteine methyltransferase